MAVKLRLTRLGRKKRPFYRIVAIDSRKRRDGAYIERLGYYHPLYDPPTVEIDAEKVLKWLHDGAIPSDTVRSLLQNQGVWTQFKLEKQGLSKDQIEKTMNEWFAARSMKAKPVTTVKTESVQEEVVEIVVEETDSNPETEEAESTDVKGSEADDSQPETNETESQN